MTNTFETGELTVSNVLAGSGAQFVPDGTVYTVEVDCTFAGNPLVGFDPSIVNLTTPDALMATVGPLPVGAECTVTETQDWGAERVTVDPDLPIVISSASEPAPVTVTNTFTSPPSIPVTGSSGVQKILVIGSVLAALGIVLAIAGRRRKGTLAR